MFKHFELVRQLLQQNNLLHCKEWGYYSAIHHSGWYISIINQWNGWREPVWPIRSQDSNNHSSSIHQKVRGAQFLRKSILLEFSYRQKPWNWLHLNCSLFNAEEHKSDYHASGHYTKIFYFDNCCLLMFVLVCKWKVGVHHLILSHFLS